MSALFPKGVKTDCEGRGPYPPVITIVCVVVPRQDPDPIGDGRLSPARTPEKMERGGWDASVPALMQRLGKEVDKGTDVRLLLPECVKCGPCETVRHR